MARLILGLLVLCLTLSSCDTLKQKFTRHKKGPNDAQDESFQPVLEPDEYPTPAQSPELNYKNQYALIKAWYFDMYNGVDNGTSPKYLQYVIKQVRKSIDEMKTLVDGPTNLKLDVLAGDLDYFQNALEMPQQMRNNSRIKSDMRDFVSILRNHLRDDKIQGHFIKAMPPSPAPTATGTSVSTSTSTK